MISVHSHLSLLSNSYSFRTGSQASEQAATASQEPDQALSSLQSKALNAIAKEIPGMEGSDLQNLDPADYTPEKVADRIAGFVASGLENARARGKSEEEIQSMYDSAIRGVEQGFAEAKDILDNLGFLEGGVADQVSATESATFDALSKLDPSAATQASGMLSGLGVAERYREAEDFELSLRTREGDEVKISFSRDFETQARFAAVSDGEGNQAAIMDVSRTERTGFQFSVQGDLSVDELDAIQDLVQDVGQVARDFYNGDVQKAFEQVSEISFDTSQLDSMNLKMTRVEQYSAAQAYRQTEQMANPEQASAGRRLGHLAREMTDSVQNPALEFLDQARDLASQILEGLAQQDSRYLNASSERQAGYRENLDRFLSGFGNLE